MLEAVTVDPERQTVSVATLGQADLDRLRGLLSDSLQRAQDCRPTSQCAMLDGGGDCASCATPPAKGWN